MLSVYSGDWLTMSYTLHTFFLSLSFTFYLCHLEIFNFYVISISTVFLWLLGFEILMFLLHFSSCIFLWQFLFIRNPFLKILFLFIYLFIYLFLAVLGLRFCARAFSSCGERGPLFIAVRGPLTVVASLVAEHKLQMCRLSSCGSRA